MDEPPSSSNNPAKRRCLNDRESDTLFMSRSPEPTTPNKSSTVEETLDDDEQDNDEEDEEENEDDDFAGESTYDESQEPFPAHPAFDQGVEAVKDKAASSVKQLESLLEQYAAVNKDLENMKEKTAEVMKSGSPRRMRVGLLGGTAAGKWTLLRRL